jgi:hypothetical protein
MGHFSMEIGAPTGSNLSGNQQDDGLQTDDNRRWRFLDYSGDFKFKSFNDKFLTVTNVSNCMLGLEVSTPDDIQSWILK